MGLENQQMTDQTAWPGKFDDVPLRVDPQREVETEFTGIYVRAMRDNIHGSYDIATLDRDSLFRWLRSRGASSNSLSTSRQLKLLA